MHEVRIKFLFLVQGQADFQHCEVLKVIKLTVMTVCDDRRLSIKILGAVGMPSIHITGPTLCLLYGSLCLVGINLVLGKVAYWVLSLRTGLSSSQTGKVRVSVGTYTLTHMGAYTYMGLEPLRDPSAKVQIYYKLCYTYMRSS